MKSDFLSLSCSSGRRRFFRRLLCLLVRSGFDVKIGFSVRNESGGLYGFGPVLILKSGSA